MFTDKAGLVEDTQIYEKMQVNEPYKRYKKTILGKVFVFYMNPFSGQMEGKLLTGNPRKNEEGCFISIWSVKEDAFFRSISNNRKHFETGRLIETPVNKAVVVTETQKTANELNDSELEELVNSKGFFKLLNTLNKMTSTDTVYRLLDVAEQNNKSDKILLAIRKRLAELGMTEAMELSEE